MTGMLKRVCLRARYETRNVNVVVRRQEVIVLATCEQGRYFVGFKILWEEFAGIVHHSLGATRTVQKTDRFIEVGQRGLFAHVSLCARGSSPRCIACETLVAPAMSAQFLSE